MAIELLAAAAISMISPYLAKAGEAAAGKVGEGAAEATGKVLGWLRAKLGGEAREALEQDEKRSGERGPPGRAQGGAGKGARGSSPARRGAGCTDPGGSSATRDADPDGERRQCEGGAGTGIGQRRDDRLTVLFPAIPAPAPHLDHRPIGLEARRLGRGADAAGDAVVVDMLGLAAIVADQEDAIVQAIGMVVGDIGVGALHPADEIGADEQVEDPIDAVGGDPAALAGRDLSAMS